MNSQVVKELDVEYLANRVSQGFAVLWAVIVLVSASLNLATGVNHTFLIHLGMALISWATLTLPRQDSVSFRLLTQVSLIVILTFTITEKQGQFAYITPFYFFIAPMVALVLPLNRALALFVPVISANFYLYLQVSGENLAFNLASFILTLVSVPLLIALISSVIERLNSSYQKLRASEQTTSKNAALQAHAKWLMETTLNSASIGYFVHNLRTGEVDSNPVLARIFDMDHFSVESMMQRVAPEDRERVQTAVKESFERRSLFNEEFRILTPDGQVRWIHSRVETIDKSGELLNLGIVEEITARKRAERERAQAAELLSMSAHSAGVYYWIVDLSNGDIEASPGYREVISDADPETLKTQFNDLTRVHPRDREKVVALKEKAIHGASRHIGDKRPLAIETYRTLNRSGAYCWYRVAVSKYEIEGREYLLIVFTDVDKEQRSNASLNRALLDLEIASDRKLESEKVLNHSRRLVSIGSMLGGMTHNLNNQLQPIRLLSGLIRKRLDHSNQAKTYLDMIDDSVNSAVTLIDRVQGFVRTETVEQSNTDLNEAVNAAYDLARIGIPSRIKSELKIEIDEGQVGLSRVDLEVVILNLINNAVQAIGVNAGELTLIVDYKTPPESVLAQLEQPDSDTWYRIRVNDTGCGMTPEQTEHCLDPFYTTKPVGEGTGLGLSESFGLVSKAGGILKVNSVENLGTQIDIYLPAVSSKDL